MLTKPTFWLILAAFVIAGSVHFATKPHSKIEIPAKVREAYIRWSSTFGRLMATPEELEFRLRVFHRNFDFVEKHKLDSSKTFTVALNQFADMTDEEFKSKYGFKTNPTPKHASTQDVAANSNTESLGQVPFVDMRGKLQQDYVVSSSSCNDNYAWVAAIAMNANYYISVNSKIVYNFSPQTYIDCSGNFGNSGCNGGFASKCFEYSSFWGIGTTSDYPYFGYQRPCRVAAGFFKNKKAIEVPSNQNNNLAALVRQEQYVLSVGLDLSSQDAKYYSGGVFNGNCAAEPTTHALLIGLGNDVVTKNNYWLIMSTFGTSWGEQGIMRLYRFTDDRGDITSSCGLNKYASYPEF